MTIRNFYLNRFIFIRSFVILGITLNCLLPTLAQRESIEYVRTRGLEMLANAKQLIQDKYYDPQFHGVDLEKEFQQAKVMIKAAKSNPEVYMIIAQFVVSLKDSHTTFSPPIFAKMVDYGIEMQMIGQICYVISVKKGSDAESKGIRVGDIVYCFQTFTPTRESFWQFDYLYYALNPVDSYKIVLLNQDKTLRELEIKASVSKTSDFLFKVARRQEMPQSSFDCKQVNGEITACKLFSFLTTPKEIDRMMKTVGSSKFLVLDLRKNRGGYVETVNRLISYFFEKKIKVGSQRTRNSSKDIYVDPHPKNLFSGKLIVLVDSLSASASEVFARVMQLEKRGVVVGDATAGAVMTGQGFEKTFVRVGYAENEMTPYGFSITISDLLMSDGKSLENVGVKPDVLILINKVHLANKLDPVLAFAVNEFGMKLSHRDAENIFPQKQ